MKKIISIGLLLPMFALAGATIDNISVTGNSFTSNGGATYGGTQSVLSVSVDSSNLLTQGGSPSTWSANGTAGNGLHTLTATVQAPDGSEAVSASREFRVSTGQGLAPCQIDGTCPDFGKFAPTIPAQNNLGGKAKFQYLRPGEGECPVWFTMNCLVKN